MKSDTSVQNTEYVSFFLDGTDVLKLNETLQYAINEINIESMAIYDDTANVDAVTLIVGDVYYYTLGTPDGYCVLTTDYTDKLKITTNYTVTSTGEVTGWTYTKSYSDTVGGYILKISSGNTIHSISFTDVDGNELNFVRIA